LELEFLERLYDKVGGDVRERLVEHIAPVGGGQANTHPQLSSQTSS
jgi:hypothetical protein